jgi:6-pyruvoyltetrahydropterin/6-carboxytetrahydropterin synthase
VYLKSDILTDYGMIADFKQLKEAIHGKLDHQYINDIVPFNPTAENMAKWICDTVNKTIDEGTCYKVSVRESEGNFATYTNDAWCSRKYGEDL